MIAAGPAISMLAGSVVVFVVRFSKTFQASMQNFSAGILLAAIGNELFPLVNNGSDGASKPPNSTQVYVGLVAGFVLGLLFMIGIETLVDTYGEGEDSDEGEERTGKEENVVDEEKVDERKSPISPLLEPSASSAYSTFTKSSKLLQTRSVMQSTLADGKLYRLVAELREAVDDPAKDEDVLDEVAHRLMFQVDRARRSLTPKIPINDEARDELRKHVRDVETVIRNLAAAKSGAESRRLLKKASTELKHLHDDHVDLRFSRWRVPAGLLTTTTTTATASGDADDESTRFPYTTVFTVSVDAAVDGVLIGLALSANRTAGISMSVATVIEMGFLGVSFSARIKQHTRENSLMHACVTSLPPLLIVLAAILGHEIGSALQNQQVVFIGFIAFSIVAILFLVTQELLREAQELAGENRLVQAAFFGGLLAALVMDRVLG